MKRTVLVMLLATWGCTDMVSPNGGSVAFVGATIVDGTGAAPRPGMTVVVEGGVISDIRPDGQATLDRTIERIDAAGKWLMPGLVDTHVHLPPPDLQEPFLQTLLSFGVTSARSTAASPPSGIEARSRIEAGELISPRFLTAGRLIDAVGSFWGFAAVVSTEAEMRAEVARQAGVGVDFIKFYVRLPPDLVTAGIDEAHAQGLRVIGHLGRTTWPEAVRAGIDALTHSCFWGMAHSLVPQVDSARFADFFLPNGGFDVAMSAEWTGIFSTSDSQFADFAALAAAGGVVIDPNLVLCEAVIFGDEQTTMDRLQTHLDVQGAPFPHPYSAHWSAAERGAAQSAFPEFLEAVAELHRGGVQLTVGSDTMNPWMTPGAATLRELELLESAGIPPHEVLEIATRQGAAALGLDGQTGTLEVGKSADLLLLTADPTVTVSNVRALELVMIEGFRYQPDQLRGGS